MLNRYGLFDMDKFLEQNQVDDDQADSNQAASHDDAGSDPQPSPQLPPDPDARIDAARLKNQAADLLDFRKRHAAIIFQIAHTRDDAEDAVDRNASLRYLRHKFETTGVDQPFFVLFDPATTGLDGDRHLALIAGLHNGGHLSDNQVVFSNAGDAAEFAEYGQNLRPDLEFTVDKTVVLVAPTSK